jgi:serine/threonine-protein kinase
VESLIKSHERAGSFITEPAMKVAARMMAEDQSTSRLGQTVSHYKVEALLGLGGMGEVYLAEDTSLKRKVALKFLPVYLTGDPERLRRLEQEARAASTLNHPNIVTVHEIGSVESTHFIATEFIDGKTLRDRIEERPLELSEALDIAAQIASALNAAHEVGVIHRDIKPDNVMLRRDGFVKVLDFGLAKLCEVTEGPPSKKLGHNTSPGMVMGTVLYMSPEQARGEEVDARTDIWSLGVVLYEMITGRVPFTGETPSHVVVSILEHEPSTLNHHGKVPAEVGDIVGKALCKNKDGRYRTANELAIDLKNLKRDLELDSRSTRSLRPSMGTSATATDRDNVTERRSGTQTRLTTPRPTSSAEYLVRKIKSHKRGAALAVATMILVVTLLGYSFVNRGGEPRASRDEPIDSLAVLPFVNESDNPNSEYLADGITDSVITRLAQLSKLRVISREVVFRYKSGQPDPLALGTQFKVRAVLIGRISQKGDSLAISTELVDVRDNSHLWGEQYDRKLSDALALQEDIALKISQGLRLRLTGEEKKKLEKRYTQNNEAYLLYSLADHNRRKRTREGIEKSIEYYDQAIKIDPKYALAYVGLAQAYFGLQFNGFQVPKRILRKREWAARKAVELDDTLSEAHAALAHVKEFRLDFAGAEQESKRALELDPNSLMANQRYALDLAYAGRMDEALVYARRRDEIDANQGNTGGSFLGYIYFLGRQYDTAIELFLREVEKAPENALSHAALGEAYVAKEMYKEGIAELEKAVALDNAPEPWDRNPLLAFAYAVSGKRDEALKILAEQKRVAKQRHISSQNFAIIYTGLGDKDRAFEYLNKAFDEGKPLAIVPVRPLFDSLRFDPRYKELLHRIGRPP